MERFNGKKLALIVLLMLIGMGLGVIVMLEGGKIGLLLLKRYADLEFLGIKGIIEILSASLFILPGIVLSPVIFMLSFKIAGVIKPLFPYIITSTEEKVDEEWLDPNCNTGISFNEANDKFLIIKIRDRKFWTYALTIMCVFFALSTTHLIVENDMSVADGAAVCFVFFLLCFLILLYNIYSPTRVVKFDRMSGMVTIPGALFFKSVTQPINNVIQGSVFNVRLMGVIHPYTCICAVIPGTFDIQWWSFYMWYMDKNRPLPQGTLFDPYREADFKRRQQEGFPEPLYESKMAISDDRSGYIYGDAEVKKIISTSRINILWAYRELYFEFLKKRDNTHKEEDMVLIGVYNKFYVFALNVTKNQPLKILKKEDLNENYYLIDRKKGKFFNVFDVFDIIAPLG